MLDLILHPSNLPFTLAIVLMLCITFIEGAGTFLGFGVSEFLDNILPDFDADLEFDAPEGDGGFSRVLGWIRIKKVPVLILLIILLTAFGIIGLSLQSLCLSTFGFYGSPWIASTGSLILSLPVVRGFGGVFARLFPKEETEVVSEKSYIGKVAYITLGRASEGSPAEAKFQDHYGTTHYVMVEPDVEGESFEQGDDV
ncbi:MAG: YqiJ family protein, partial [Chlorobiales bacterium]|nr:YqiJ family protein [Chlorobiales bacterium]